MGENERWGIWIDVEGFSNLWSAGTLALRGLSQLTSLIFDIGRDCFPDEPDRLFAHQIGDGFYIASSFHEPNLDRCAAIATVLMRGMTEVGCVARAAIAEGSLADYSGCRPRHVRDHAVRRGDTDVVPLGQGIMTLQAVMGQGIINAVTLDKLTKTKGALLSLAAKKVPRLSTAFITRPLDEAPDIMAIDWVHSAAPEIDEIARRARIPNPPPGEVGERLTSYIAEQGLDASWSEPTRRFAGL